MLICPNFYLGPPEEQKGYSKGWMIFYDWARFISSAITIYLFFTVIFFELYQIPSSSMEPTLYGHPGFFTGDRVVALKWMSTFYRFKRGDIIVFVSVEDGKTLIVKRLVGLPGDKIQVRAPHVYINGKKLLDPPVFRSLKYCEAGQYGIGEPFVVPEGHYFVMGDNSGNSNDSRFWGPLPIKKVLGKAVLIFWPIPHARFL